MKYRDEPHYSCPSLDAAIESIEEARKINDKLRGDNRQFDSDLDAARAEIQELVAQVQGLEAKIAELEGELNE